MKARLALLLGKTYVQEQPLRWGYLTPAREDTPHRRVRIEGRRKTRDPVDGPPLMGRAGDLPGSVRDPGASGRTGTIGLLSGGRAGGARALSSLERPQRDGATTRVERDTRTIGRATVAAVAARSSHDTQARQLRH